MPRNGTTGIATQPVNTRAVTGETIMAEKWNSVTDDVYSILSTATPLTQGGTGASTAAGARTALDVYAKSETYAKSEVDGFRTTDQNAAKNASNLSSGTVPDARLPARLQSGSSLSIANQAEAEAGTENTKAMTALRTKQQIDARFKAYTSSEISIVTSSLTTLTHGLGAEPKRVRAYLLCKTAEKGYAVGAKVELNQSTIYLASANDASGIQLSLPNATTIGISVGNYLPFFPNRAGGGGTYITAANWRIIVEASL